MLCLFIRGVMKILLHACCGPCATVAIEKLLEVGDVTVLYYNPNTYPESEWNKRREALEILISKMSKEKNRKIGYICPDYRPEPFIDMVKKKKLGNEKEGGSRCSECFRIRLSKTAEIAKLEGFDAFTTSLTVSPHKDAKIINKLGKEIGNCLDIEFLECDFKKQNGFYNSILLSKKYGLYRQNYCGCEFSLSFKDVLENEGVKYKSDK